MLESYQLDCLSHGHDFHTFLANNQIVSGPDIMNLFIERSFFQ